MSSDLIRSSGLAAILGGVLGILLTPLLTYLWATNSDVYGYFGRAYFLVFMGCLSALAPNGPATARDQLVDSRASGKDVRGRGSGGTPRPETTCLST